MAEILMTRAQVAEMLGVPIGTLANWAYQRVGPRFYRIGRHTRYRQEDVLAWLETRSQEPTAAV